MIKTLSLSKKDNSNDNGFSEGCDKTNGFKINNSNEISLIKIDSKLEDSLFKVKGVISRSLFTQETLISHVIGRLYISYNTSPQFEYTDIEGIIGIVVNRKTHTLLLQIYDTLDIKKEFEIELYKNINEGYHVITDTFHSIEYPTFFLGINFSTKPFAKQFKDSLFIHSIILNAEKNQFNYQQETKRKEIQIKIGRIEDLVQFHYNNLNGDLVYDISKEATNYIERMGISVSKLNTEYENLRGEIKYKKCEGRENVSDEIQEDCNKMISLMNDNDVNRKEDYSDEEGNRERDRDRDKDIEELTIRNKVSKKVKQNKGTQRKMTFVKQNENKMLKLGDNDVNLESMKRKDHPKRKTKNTDFNTILSKIGKGSVVDTKERLYSIQQEEIE